MSNVIIQTGNYVKLESDNNEILSMPYNLYKMALRRDVNDIRNPQAINIKGSSLVFTENEWKKIQKINFLEVYRFEKKDRFDILKVRQKQINIRFLNEANAASCR